MLTEFYVMIEDHDYVTNQMTVSPKHNHKNARELFFVMVALYSSSLASCIHRISLSYTSLAWLLETTTHCMDSTIDGPSPFSAFYFFGAPFPLLSLLCCGHMLIVALPCLHGLHCSYYPNLGNWHSISPSRLSRPGGRGGMERTVHGGFLSSEADFGEVLSLSGSFWINQKRKGLGFVTITLNWLSF